MFEYVRLDHPDLLVKMNEIYNDFWNPLHNFFIPSMKLISKEKIDVKWKKHYNKAMTSFQRVINNPKVSDDKKAALKIQKEKLNPFELRLNLETKLKEFFDLTKKVTAVEQIKIAA